MQAELDPRSAAGTQNANTRWEAARLRKQGLARASSRTGSFTHSTSSATTPTREPRLHGRPSGTSDTMHPAATKANF